LQASVRDEISACAGCHNQCEFVTAEVFARGSSAVATPRKALVVLAALSGELGWDDAVVDIVYSGLSSGAQHAVCVYRGSSGLWPDETRWLRATRREIVLAGRAPKWACDIAERARSAGDPYGLGGSWELVTAPVVLWTDAATRYMEPGVASLWPRLVGPALSPGGLVSGGSSGFELYDLGFDDDAAEAAKRVAEQVAAMQSTGATVVTDSPEAAWMAREVWPGWGIKLPTPVLHLATWLAKRLQRGDEHVRIGPLTFQDPSYLARYLGDLKSPRQLLRHSGADLHEMTRHGEEAVPACSFHGAAPGAWTRSLAQARAASARAVGAEAIVTASPFDHAELNTVMPTSSLWTVVYDALASGAARHKPVPLPA